MRKLIIILLFISSTLISQTTYYVHPDSTLNLISEVNALTLSPGDSVLFARGQTWVVTSTDEYLKPMTHSGTAGAPIYYGAYGTGAKPIITGRQSLPGWNNTANWTDQGSNIWSATTILPNLYFYTQNNRGRLFLNGSEVMKYPSNAIFTPNASTPWTHNGLTLYVYATSNPATYYSNIEVPAITNPTIEATQSYLKFENLDLQGGGNSVQFTNAHYLEFDSVLIGKWCAQSGAVFHNCDNLEIIRCEFDTYDRMDDTYEMNNSEDGLTIQNGSDNVNISYSLFKDWGHANYQLKTSGTVDPPVTNVKFFNNTSTSPNTDYGRAFLYNIADETGGCIGNEMYNNLMVDHPARSQISGPNMKFYNNIYDGTRSTTYRTDVGVGFVITNYTTDSVYNNWIVNNVIMNAENYGMAFDYGQNNYSAYIINNIFFNNDDDGYLQMWRSNSANNLYHTFKNNLFYEAGGTDVIRYEFLGGANDITVTEFNALNEVYGDTIMNNIQADPLLTNYEPQEGSPVIGAGIVIDWLMTDYNGNAYAATPSIGAFEYDGTPPTPAAPDAIRAIRSTKTIKMGNKTTVIN